MTEDKREISVGFSRREGLTWFIPADTPLDGVDILLHYGGHITTPDGRQVMMIYPGNAEEQPLRICLGPLRISLEDTNSIS